MSVLDMVASEHDWPRLLDALDAELPAYRGVWTAVDAIVASGEDRTELDEVAREHDWPRLLEALDAELPAYRGVWTAVDAIVAGGEDRTELYEVVDERDRLRDRLERLRDRLERLRALCGVVAEMSQPDRGSVADLARLVADAAEYADKAAQ